MVRSYGNLFNAEGEGVGGDGEEGTEPDEAVGFRSHWGWLATIDELSNGQRKDWDYYLNMKLMEFFNCIAFLKDKKENESDTIKKLLKGKTNEEAQTLLLAHLCSK